MYGWLAAEALLEKRDATSENANLNILVRGIRMPMGRLQCGDIVGGGIMERRHQTKALFRPPSLRRCNTEQNTIAGLGRGEMVKGDVRFTEALRTLSISSPAMHRNHLEHQRRTLRLLVTTAKLVSRHGPSLPH